MLFEKLFLLEIEIIGGEGEWELLFGRRWEENSSEDLVLFDTFYPIKFELRPTHILLWSFYIFNVYHPLEIVEETKSFILEFVENVSGFIQY